MEPGWPASADQGQGTHQALRKLNIAPKTRKDSCSLLANLTFWKVLGKEMAPELSPRRGFKVCWAGCLTATHMAVVSQACRNGQAEYGWPPARDSSGMNSSTTAVPGSHQMFCYTCLRGGALLLRYKTFLPV